MVNAVQIYSIMLELSLNELPEAEFYEGELLLELLVQFLLQVGRLHVLNNTRLKKYYIKNFLINFVMKCKKKMIWHMKHF